jgi:NhaP-type Na+/H+ or K+/H+ antiporter
MVAIVIGLSAMLVVQQIDPDNHPLDDFDPTFFFNVLLPPIVFSAGFNMRKRNFFRYFGVIFLMGVVGTVIMLVCLGLIARWTSVNKVLEGADGSYIQLSPLDSLKLATLLCSTDTVVALSMLDAEAYPLLYGVLSGEGILNDAITISVFRAFENFETFSQEDAWFLAWRSAEVLVCSGLLGLLFGLLSGFTSHRQEMVPFREIGVIFLIAFIAYACAEALGLSGIISTFTCGLVMSHYTYHNVSDPAKYSTAHTFGSVGYMAEMLVYLSLGLYLIQSLNISSLSWALPSIMMGSILIVRLITVVLFATVVNWFHSNSQISWRSQVVIVWGGLIRGVITFALCLELEGKRQHKTGNPMSNTTVADAITPSPIYMSSSTTSIKNTALVIVAFSNVILSPLTQLLLKGLNIPETPPSQNMAFRATGYIGKAWKRLETSFMKPAFGGTRDSPSTSAHSEQHQEQRVDQSASAGNSRKGHVALPPPDVPIWGILSNRSGSAGASFHGDASARTGSSVRSWRQRQFNPQASLSRGGHASTSYGGSHSEFEQPTSPSYSSGDKEALHRRSEPLHEALLPGQP